MSGFASIAVALVVAWAALVITSQLQNPDQSPLSMGMSGLARGRFPWVMKSSFIVRGLSALALVAALPARLDVASLVLVGAALLTVWGVGSAALALADTDMPGERPTSAGAAHAVIALVAYVAGAAGAIAVSVAWLRSTGHTGVAIWALPVAVTATVALLVQFVAFGAQAREARSAAAGPQVPGAAEAGVPAAMSSSAAAASAAAAVSSPAPAPPAAGVPPLLGAGLAAPAPATSPPRPDRPHGPAGLLHDLAGYAGLYQRIFVGLLMAWTLLIALGIAL